MAAPIYSVSKKRSSDRKNPANAEFEAKRRKATNAARPKQVWIESQLFNPETNEFVRDAHWSRG
jgi:hypothetical protein